MVTINRSIKDFDQVHHCSMIRALEKLRIEGIFISIVKAVYNKPIANTGLNEKRNESL